MRRLGTKSGGMVAALVIAASLAAATPAVAIAGDKGEAPAAGPVDYAAQDKQEAKDAKIVQDVMTAFQRGGFAALGSQRSALIAVLDRAPATYPLEEVRGDKVILRYDSGAEIAAITSGLRGGPSNNIVLSYNTYGMAALMLGSYANEMRDPESAAYYLDRGLALQPGNPFLVGERHVAYILQGRSADSLAMVDAALAAPLFLTDTDRAHLLRNRGYDLIELGRLDEAEQAYLQSLELEPGHQGALKELNFIKLARQGRPPYGQVEVITSDKAKTGDVPSEDAK